MRTIKAYPLQQVGRNMIIVPKSNTLRYVSFDGINGPILAHFEVDDTGEQTTVVVYLFKEGEEIKGLGGDFKFINVVRPVDVTYYCYLNHSGW